MEQLRYLSEIAKTGTISGAAKKLYVSQQAVSSSMKQLEEELGVELLVRGTSGVTFTSIGREVAEFARETMQRHDLLMQRIQYWQEIQYNTELNINIASTSCVLNDVIPNVLSKLDYLNANVTMQVTLLTNASEVLTQVKAKQYDMGLVTCSEPLLQEECAKYDLATEILARDEVVAVAEQRVVNAEKVGITHDELTMHQMSVFNLEMYPEWRKQITKGISTSNDINFHRKMMHERDAYVMMPNIASKKFFHKAKYKSMMFEDRPAEIVHAAVYPKKYYSEIKEIVSFIRQEMLF